MMRMLKVLALALGLLMSVMSAWATQSAFPPDIAAIKQRGVLKVAVYKLDVPSLSMRDSQGNWSGIEIDLAQLIADQLGVKLVVVPADNYDAMIDMVAHNQVDLGTELAILPDRALRVAFTHPYYGYHPHLLVNRLQAAKNGLNSADNIEAALDAGKVSISIGILSGSASRHLMELSFPQAKLVDYTDMSVAFNDVVQGKIFAAMGTTPVQVQNFLKTNPKASLLSEDMQVPKTKLLAAIALPWQDFHLRELLNSYFTYLQQNGVLETIFEKYGETAT